MALTAAQVIERVFTTTNPATGSQPPSDIAWVVFEHGTCFFSVPTDELPLDATPDALVAAARAALASLGPAIPGTPAADFTPSRLDGWFPDEPVWFVAYDHSAIATIVITDGSELEAGLRARALRDDDHDAPVPTLVRGFDGTTWTPESV